MKNPIFFESLNSAYLFMTSDNNCRGFDAIYVSSELKAIEEFHKSRINYSSKM